MDNKEEDFRKSYKKYNGYKAAKNIKCPVLIIHGDADDVVPLSQSKKLDRLLKNSTLIAVKGLTHDYNEKELHQMAQHVTNFFVAITKNYK